MKRMLGILIILAATCLWAGPALAAHRPVPLMDFVPQEAGIYDTSHDNLAEADCRFCHGSSTADRHHYSPLGLSGGCLQCHDVQGPPDYGVEVYRNCTLSRCHDPAAGSPHHATAEALAGECARCHDPQLVSSLSAAGSGTPQVSVPTPCSCENCHWGQERSGLLPSTDQHYNPWGDLEANWHFDVPGFSLQPLEQYEEPGDNGWLYSRPIGGNQTNHHAGGLYRGCTDCHLYADGLPGPDPQDAALMRQCERCHPKERLHNVKGHVEAFEGRVGPGTGYNAAAWEAAEVSATPEATVYRLFSASERCAGCHGSAPAAPPPSAVLPPYLDLASPNAGEPGAVIELWGIGFGEALLPGCEVQCGGEGTGGQWVGLPVISWAPTAIAVRIPRWVFPVGNYRMRVVTPDGTSNELGCTMTDCCSMHDIDTDMDPAGFNGDSYSQGPLYCKVFLMGTGGYGAASAGQYGSVSFFTQVLLQAVGGRTFIIADSNLRGGTPDPRASVSGQGSILSWSDTTLSFRLQRLWEDTNGNYVCDGEAGSGENVLVPLSEVTPGDYDVRVRIVYWVDANANGVLDPDTEVTMVTQSDPLALAVNTDPYLRSLKPQPVVAGQRTILVGVNLGQTQGDSTVNIYKGDGVTLAMQLAADSPRMRSWGPEKVAFRIPGKAGQVRLISVTVGGQESNKIKVKLN
jgi:hypothetical protein